ncbi:MAG TPA: hypothetical protein VMV40_00800, partial [Acidiferrobacter sp.]|nr:hypothetical protein [Acidiferrobacter sp.]
GGRMSENERLREALEIVRVNCNTWSERKLSTEADRKTFAWLARRASNALDAEPETCVKRKNRCTTDPEREGRL